MRTSLLLTAATAAVLTLSACHKKSEAGGNAYSGNAAATETGNGMASLNPGQSGPVNAAQDVTGAAVGAMSASTLGSHDTGAFVDNSGQGDMYEIQAAR